MAKPTTYVGSNVYIQLETATAGTFTRPCGLTNHTVSFTKNMQEIDVPDCDDLEAPAWIERGVQSLDFSADGSGVLAAESIERWWDAFNSTESVNARVYVGAVTDTTNGYFWAGKVHVSGFDVTGERGGKAQASIKLVSDGEMVFTPVGP